MARLVFPDEGSRLVYSAQNDGQSLLSRKGRPVLVYTDAGATILADIVDMSDVAISGSQLTVDANSLLPLFKGPDGVDTLYVKASGSSTVAPLYARIDDRIDNMLLDPLRIGYPTLWHSHGWVTSADTNTMNVANRVQWARFIAGGPMNRINYRVGTQSGNMAFAIYDSTGDGLSKAPNTRLWTSGSFAMPAAGARTLDIGSTLQIDPAVHWLAWGIDNTTGAIHVHVRPVQNFSRANGWSGYASSAFPPANPAPALTAGLILLPFVIGEVV